jgi:hypothetical protein
VAPEVADAAGPTGSADRKALCAESAGGTHDEAANAAGDGAAKAAGEDVVTGADNDAPGLSNGFASLPAGGGEDTVGGGPTGEVLGSLLEPTGVEVTCDPME